MTMLTIPRGRAAVSEDAAARKRREVREKLLRGETVRVSQRGTIRGQNDPAPNNEPAIVVPAGKLAAGFHWYENDPDLLVEEKGAMRHFFPQFPRIAGAQAEIFSHPLQITRSIQVD